MKKRAWVCILVIALLLSISAQAATQRAITLYPSLSFSGTTANCSISILGATNDTFYVTLKLWRGSTCLATWHDSGSGYVTMSETETVEPGYTYDLTADVVINGTLQPRVSVQATCP